MSKTGPSFREFVSQHLHESLRRQLGATYEPLAAFERLSEKCDREFLTWQFFTLAASRGENPIFALDSWKATGGRTAEDLDAIKARVLKLLKEIEKLRRTPLIGVLAADPKMKKIKQGDLLHPYCDFRLPFEGILGLPRFVRGDDPYLPTVRKTESKYEPTPAIGPQKKPTFNEILTGIVKHVYEHTGRWHDREVAEVLHALDLPHGTTDSLKNWRNQRGLVSKRRR